MPPVGSGLMDVSIHPRLEHRLSKAVTKRTDLISMWLTFSTMVECIRESAVKASEGEPSAMMEESELRM
jgi:hypothetical protein